MKFKTLSGDLNWQTYGGKWISPKLNNGEFDYWLVLEFINMDEACGRDNEGQSKYNVSLSAVSPSQVSAENLKNAIASCGPDNQNLWFDSICQVECLHSYGISSYLWDGNGNNIAKLMREARCQARVKGDMMFGFAMDKTVNRIGTTGWEAIKGDLDSALHRTIASGSIEGNILAKMHGLN